MSEHYDIVIVGGGAVGLSLLHSLSQIGCFKIALLESRSSSNQVLNQLPGKASSHSQDRSIVLSHSSRKFYESIDHWTKIAPDTIAIKDIEVSVKGKYGTSVLTAPEGPLGYVISLHRLEHILEHNVEHNIHTGAKLIDCAYSDSVWHLNYIQNGSEKKIKAQWLIGADGPDSLVRIQNNIGVSKKTYAHQAIIGTVQTQGHHNRAFERILKKGAIAVLPLSQDRAVFIWSLQSAEASQYFEAPEDVLLNILQDEFGYRLGTLCELESKKIFPLIMSQAAAQGDAYKKVLLMGTAALNLHPIGAQGLNLSLRNIASLSTQIRAQLHEQACLSIEKLIQDYIQSVKADQLQAQWTTDALATYVADGPFPPFCRALGLILFDSMHHIKNTFTQMNMGLGVL